MRPGSLDDLTELVEAARDIVLGPYAYDDALPSIESRLLLLAALGDKVDREARARGEEPGDSVQRDCATLAARIARLRAAVVAVSLEDNSAQGGDA